MAVEVRVKGVFPTCPRHTDASVALKVRPLSLG